MPRRLVPATALTLLLAATPAAAQGPRRATDGPIATTAGTVAGCCNDGGPATQGLLNAPRDVAVAPDGSVLVADRDNNRIRRIAPNGTITTDAGTGNAGGCCDGGPATDAELDHPRGIAPLSGGGYLIADTGNDRIRRVAPDGTISTVATGFAQPSDIEPLPGGGFLVADTGHHQIRRVAPDGSVSVVAGTTQGLAGDGGPATAARLNGPRDVALASDGALLVADSDNHRVRRIGADGRIFTVAGGDLGFAGDGGPATAARLGQVLGVTALDNGGFLVADTSNDRVRRVTPLGAIFTVAGIGGGLAGDGGAAKAARLTAPAALARIPGSSAFLVADTGNARVRRVGDIGAIPRAEVGRSAYVYPAVAGVTVQVKGAFAPLPLREEDLVPISSLADATTGKIEVRTAFDDQGNQQTAELYAGAFTLLQQGTRSAPTTIFRLPPLGDCGATRRTSPFAVAARAAAKRRKKRRGGTRRLWVSEKGGRWKSSTGSTSAAAVGTAWLTTLLCDGTRVTVTEGRVAVRDKLRGRTTVVPAGSSVKVRATGRFAGQ